MRALFRLLFLLLLFGLALAFAGAWLALSDAPLVVQRGGLSHADVARAEEILRHNDPRRLPAGTERNIDIDARDLELALNYLMHQRGGAAQVGVSGQALSVRATLRVPDLPVRPYLNIAAQVPAGKGSPRLGALRIGAIDLPMSLVGPSVNDLLVHLLQRTGAGPGLEAIKELQTTDHRLRVVYEWNPVLLERARDTLLSLPDRESLRYYHDLLIDLQAQDIGRHGSLAALLQPMFSAALVRSQTRDPVLENTALLTVMGAWASRHDLARLVPGDLARPQAFRLKIARRTDFAQHFLVSAALAARGDRNLSDAVGVYKEITDTDQGTGFSFTDIAADRAGTRFGEAATSDRPAAQTMQRRIAGGIAEQDFMPPATDLPEHMAAAEFRQRYGNVGSPAYVETMREIERRIAALALYQP